MARKNNKSKKQAKATGAASANAASIQSFHGLGTPSNDALPTELGKALRKGKYDRALQLLGELWPATESIVNSERMQVLLRFWPEQALRELQAVPELLDAPATAVLVAPWILSFDEQQWQQLVDLNPVWLGDGVAVRAAAASLAQRHDDDAQTALRSIGLRSPFRDSRLFLKSLAAFYEQRSDEAIRGFTALLDTKPFNNFARAALFMLMDQPDSEHEAISGWDPAVWQILTQLGGQDWTSYAALRAIGGLLARRRPNAALRLITQTFRSLDRSSQAMLMADLPGGLQSLGLEPEDVIERMERALSTKIARNDRRRLLALAYQLNGHLVTSLDLWHEIDSQLKQGKWEFGGTDNVRMGRAAVNQRMANMLFEMADHEEDERSISWYWGRRSSSVSPHREHAIEHLDIVLELDPNRLDTWLQLAKAWEASNDKAEKGRVLERMVALFPEHPESLLSAAHAATERKSYDKALGYLNRAAEQEPLDRTIRDFQALVLSYKARKKLTSHDVAKAELLYREAAAIPHRTLDSRLKTSAERAVFLDRHVNHDKAYAEFERCKHEDGFGWSWLMYVCVARRNLDLHLDRNGTGGTQLIQWRSYLTGPPGLAEWPVMLNVVESDTQLDLNSTDMRTVLEEACICADVLPEHEGVLLQLVHYLSETHPVALRVAEHAHRLFPKNHQFLHERYASALRFQRPESYFSSALGELDAVISVLEKQVQAIHEDNPYEIFFGNSGPGVEAYHALKQLRGRIDRYMSKPGTSTKAKSETRGKTKGNRAATAGGMTGGKAKGNTTGDSRAKQVTDTTGAEQQEIPFAQEQK